MDSTPWLIDAYVTIHFRYCLEGQDASGEEILNDRSINVNVVKSITRSFKTKLRYRWKFVLSTSDDSFHFFPPCSKYAAEKRQLPIFNSTSSHKSIAELLTSSPSDSHQPTITIQMRIKVE
jgi:hypothetical protein